MQGIVILIAGFTFVICVLVLGLASIFVLLYLSFRFLKRRYNSTSNDPESPVQTSADNSQENAADEIKRRTNLRLEAQTFENKAQAALIEAFHSTTNEAPPERVVDRFCEDEPEMDELRSETRVVEYIMYGRNASKKGLLAYIDAVDNEGVCMNIIAAVDEAMCIGKDGVLPWNIPSEFQYFLSMTSRPKPGCKNAVIVGRKTWETMDKLTTKPLPNALNIVLSRGILPEATHYLNTVVAHSLKEAVNIIKRETDIEELIIVWVIGGGQIYALTMQSPYFLRLYLTHIHARFGCDTYFPFMKQELEYGSAFRRLSQEEICDPRVPVEIQTDPTTGIRFEIRVYEKRNVC